MQLVCRRTLPPGRNGVCGYLVSILKNGRCTGVVDGYWEFRLKPWDMAAGVLIAREAGAKITTMDGQPFTVFSRSVLAANDGIHPAILEKTQVKTEGLMGRGIDMSPWFLPEGYQVSEITL